MARPPAPYVRDQRQSHETEHPMRRTALVTGASRGLGRALATALAADGWNVVVDGRDAAALDAARARIDAAGPGEVVALTGDIDDPIHVAGLVGAAVDQGRFGLLVNNVGTLGPSPLPPVTRLRPDDLERTLRTNVVAPLRLSRPPSPPPQRRRGPQRHVRRRRRGLRGLGRLRRLEGGARAAEPGAGRRGARGAGVLGRPGRHADADAPGRLPRRGHLRPPVARVRVPGLLALLVDDRPAAATVSTTRSPDAG